MVDGLTIDMNSPKPDCEACIQAKQTIEPFNQISNHKTEPRDLTHIDLWGKYQLSSTINIIYYLLMMLDITSQYSS